MNFKKAIEIIKEYPYPFKELKDKSRETLTIVRDLEKEDVNNKLLLIGKIGIDNYLLLVENKDGIGYKKVDLESLNEDEFRDILNSLDQITYLTEESYHKRIKEIQDRFITIARTILGNEDYINSEELGYYNTDCTLSIFRIYLKEDKIGYFLYLKNSEEESESSNIEYVMSTFLGMTDEEFIERCREVSNFRDKKSELFYKSRESNN